MIAFLFLHRNPELQSIQGGETVGKHLELEWQTLLDRIRQQSVE